MQSALLRAPVDIVQRLPQLVHATAPTVVLYFPTSHAEQGPPSGPVKPALQTQAVIALLPAGEVLDAGQAEHVLVPTVYDPDAHIVQVPPLVPVYPALQTQAVITELPTGEVLEVGQGVHVLVPTVYDPAAHIMQAPPLAPVYPALQMHAALLVAADGEVLWGGQSSHAAEPVLVLYFPAPHRLQMLLEGYSSHSNDDGVA
jgi:hypothetical protein